MIRVVLLLLLACASAAACGGGGGAGGDGPGGGGGSAGPGEGSLIIANLATIVERPLSGGAERTLLTAPEANAFVLDPAVSPGGGQVAFIMQPPATIVDGRFDSGSDLWVMGRDGSGARAVFEHEQANQLVRFPRWLDEQTVLAIVQEIDTSTDVTRVVYTLQRVDVGTGARERLLDDVLAFDVSADGQQLVYSKLLPQTGESLQTSGVGGAGEATELIGLEQRLAPFGYPRFSPDGASVAFASADQAGAEAGPRLVSLSGAGGAVGRPEAVLVDGLPQDVWTVAADGGGAAVRVADIKEDLPSITWDGSGERIYALGVQGLYEIDVTSGSVEVIGGGLYHAQVDWAP